MWPSNPDLSHEVPRAYVRCPRAVLKCVSVTHSHRLPQVCVCPSQVVQACHRQAPWSMFLGCVLWTHSHAVCASRWLKYKFFKKRLILSVENGERDLSSSVFSEHLPWKTSKCFLTSLKCTPLETRQGALVSQPFFLFLFSSYMYDPGMSFSRTWEPSFWNVHIGSHGTLGA